MVITGTDVVLTVAGQTFSAGLISFSKGTSLVTITIEDGELSFTDGAGNALVRATDINGEINLVSGTGAGSGVYGGISGTVAVDVPGVAFVGDLQVELNTTDDDTLEVNGEPARRRHRPTSRPTTSAS